MLQIVEILFLEVPRITLVRIFHKEHMYLKGKYQFISLFFLTGVCYRSLRKGCCNNRSTEIFNYSELVDSAIIYNLSHLILVNKCSDP